MEHRSSSPNDSNEGCYDRTEKQSQDAQSKEISFEQYMRIFSPRHDPQVGTNEASSSRSDRQSAIQIEDYSSENKVVTVPSDTQDKRKGSASQEGNERAGDENDEPLERLELASDSTPEKLRLLGGMRGRYDQTRREARAEDLAQMSPSEHVDWCVHGGIAEAFRPDGDRTLIPAIKDMLRDERIARRVRKGIAEGIGVTEPSEDTIHEMTQMLRNDRIDSSVRKVVAKGIGA
jgi:hypothetical protein